MATRKKRGLLGSQFGTRISSPSRTVATARGRRPNPLAFTTLPTQARTAVKGVAPNFVRIGGKPVSFGNPLTAAGRGQFGSAAGRSTGFGGPFKIPGIRPFAFSGEQRGGRLVDVNAPQRRAERLAQRTAIGAENIDRATAFGQQHLREVNRGQRARNAAFLASQGLERLASVPGLLDIGLSQFNAAPLQSARGKLGRGLGTVRGPTAQRLVDSFDPGPLSIFPSGRELTARRVFQQGQQRRSTEQAELRNAVERQARALGTLSRARGLGANVPGFLENMLNPEAAESFSRNAVQIARRRRSFENQLKELQLARERTGQREQNVRLAEREQRVGEQFQTMLDDVNARFARLNRIGSPEHLRAIQELEREFSRTA